MPTQQLWHRRPLLAANWKMNPVSAAEAAQLVNGTLSAAQRQEVVEVALFPPFPWLLGVAELLEGSRIELGAQNCFWERSGAHTGEVAPSMLAGWCQWVILGHSERRQHHGETDEQVARKAMAALAEGLSVIVCVGEREQEYEAGETDSVVTRHIEGSLAGLTADDSTRLVVAYEPVWAIGTGKNADPEHAYRTMRLVRNVVAGLIGDGASQRVRVLYGGSVTASNIEAYVELPQCDGCLVGGASLRAEEFSRMIEVTAEVYGPSQSPLVPKVPPAP